MRVLLIDDHSLFRRGLRLMLRDLMADADVHEAADVAGALGLADERFDLILLDMHMPGLQGLQALDAVRQGFAAAVVVVVSGDDDPALIREALAHGAAGFIPKTAEPEVMHGALRLVLARGIYLPPQAVAQAAEPRAEAMLALSPRQAAVLRMALTGAPNKVISRVLGISEGTVKSHLSAAYRIMNVRNRTEALYSAARLGFKLE